MGESYFLSRGSHPSAADGLCAMEFVAHLAGEPHSDAPKCVSSALQAFCVSFNDALPYKERQRLLPFLPRTIGTRGDGLDEARSWLATDWLIRTHTPAWLDLAGLDEIAIRLRDRVSVLTPKDVDLAMDDIREAHRQATAAKIAGLVATELAASNAVRGGVAWNDAWNVAWASARHAAWTSAGSAASAAAEVTCGLAARVTAKAAAETAAMVAVWASDGVAEDALAPTVRELQQSAFELLDRMLPAEIVRLSDAPDADPMCGISRR